MMLRRYHKDVRALRRIAAAMLAAAVLVVISACSGGATHATSDPSSQATSGAATTPTLTQVSGLLTKAEQPATFRAPGPQINAASARGKRIFMLVVDAPVPYVQQLYAGVEDAAKSAGMTVTLGDAKNQLTEAVRLLGLAVSQTYDAIVIFGYEPNQLSNALKLVKQAGIPVVLSDTGDPAAVSSDEQQKWNIFAQVNPCYSCAAALIADYAIVHTNAKVSALVTWDPTTGASTAVHDGFKAELTKWCPNTCAAKYSVTPGATVMQATTSAVQAALLDPNLNFIMPEYDGFIEAVLPLITAAHAQGRVQVGGINGSISQMHELANGTPVKVEVATPVGWHGWAVVDEVLRSLTGGSAAANDNLPLRLFDAQNIGTINLKADPGSWYGPADYRAAYKQLWNLG
jgi:ribose transport system substrate-binding protein